jgi:hypothetical protein
MLLFTVVRQSRDRAIAHRDKTFQCFLELGWHVNEKKKKKSEFEPAQQVRFLEVQFDMVAMLMALLLGKLITFRPLRVFGNPSSCVFFGGPFVVRHALRSVPQGEHSAVSMAPEAL